MSGNQLGQFLRSCRASLNPTEVGLSGTGVRRVAGLRREEVAVLAGISAAYYARLEQGRDKNPSGQIIDAIAGVLRLDSPARRHVYHLAGLTPKAEPVAGPDRAEPALVTLMAAFPTAVACIVNHRLAILASNALADALLSPLTDSHNVVRMLMRDRVARELLAEWQAVARDSVEKDQPARLSKAFHHPEVGRIVLDYQAFEAQEASGQYLLVGTAADGSADADSLALLGSLHA